MENKKLTNEVGAPVSENEHSLTSGPRGPVALQDIWLLEKLAHFDREVIPERRMHAKGWGAYGTFTCTHDISQWTKAKVLQKGATTDLFIRFSTVAGERGAADAGVAGKDVLVENGALPTPSVILEGLRLNFIPKKATGTWWEIIPLHFSCGMYIISRI